MKSLEKKQQESIPETNVLKSKMYMATILTTW